MLFAQELELVQLPLLALIVAMSAYVGALRLWYHKLRTDAVDAIRKDRIAFGYMAGRLRTAVVWLRVLMVVDLVLLVGAVTAFRQTFGAYLPGEGFGYVDSPQRIVLLARVGFVLICLFCLVHAYGGSQAWGHSLTYDELSARAAAARATAVREAARHASAADAGVAAEAVESADAARRDAEYREWLLAVQQGGSLLLAIVVLILAFCVRSAGEVS
jgi:hypothetical protein